MKPRILSTARLSFSLASAIAALIAAPAAHAAPYNWIGATAGTWNTTTNWSGSVVPLITDDLTILGPLNVAGALNISFNANNSAKSLNFTNTATTTLTSVGGTVLTLGSSGITTGAGAVQIGANSANAINITLDAAQTWNVGAGGLTVTNFIGGAGSTALTKTGAGNLLLNTGIGNGFTGDITVNAGTLTANFANFNGNQLLASTNALTVGGAGTFSIIGNNTAAAANIQTFASTTLNAGRNNFVLAKGGSGASVTLNLGALTVNPGSVTAFSTPAATPWTTTASTTERVFITAGGAGTVPIPLSGNQFINGVFFRAAAAAGQARWAAVNSSGQLLAGAALTNLAAGSASTPTAPMQFQGAASIALTNTSLSTYGLLLNTGSNGLTLTLAAGGTYTLNSIIQQQSANGVSINAGTGASNIIIGSERNLVLNMDNAAGLTINAPIANNGGGSSSVTIASTAPTGTTPGNIAFGGANTYTGATYIRNGFLTLTNVSALGGTTPGTDGTSAITIANGATLRSAITGIVTNAPISIASAATISSNITGSGTSTRSFTLGGAITGTGNVTFSSDSATNSYAVTLLNAASSYVGNTTISATVGNTQSIVRLGIDNALPIATQLTITGNDTTAGRISALDLRGFNQEIAGLTAGVTTNRGLRVINSLSNTVAGTLTINTPISTSFTFAGQIGAGAAGTLTGTSFNLAKSGAGTQILTGTNDFTGSTRVSGGILSLGNALALRNSAFDTANSITGAIGDGLRTTVTTLTLGGLTGNKNFADVFTSTTGGYTGLTTLTLNPGTGVTNSYAADIGDGATGMNLIKSGAGTQILAAAQTYTGSTTSTGGALIGTTTAALPGYNAAGKLIFNGGTIGVQVGGGAWTTAEIDTLLSNATKTSGALGIDTTNGSLTQWTAFTTTNLGPLGLNKLGANNLTLDQANTFTGTTTVTAGTLTLTNSLALQNSPLNFSGGSVVLSGLTTLNLGGLNGSGTLDVTGLTNLTLNTPAGASLSYSGVIADGVIGMTVTKTGAGTQALTGTNSYTGATQIDGGVLVFGNKVSKSAGSAVTAAAAGIIGLGVKAADAAFYSEIEVGTLFNTNALAGFNLNAASGVAIDTTNAVTAFDQTVALTAARSLTKVGTGTLILSTPNTHASTTLSGGILRAGIGGALGSGTVTLKDSALQLQVTDGVTIANNITISVGAGSGTGSQGLIQNTSTGNATLSGSTITIDASPSAGGHFASFTAGTLTVAGSITATVPVTVRAGTVIFSGGGSYSSMAVSQGTVRLGADNGLSTSASLNMGALNPSNFDLAGFNQTMVGLVKSTSTATVGNSSTTNDSLLTTTGTSIFGGVIQDVLGTGTRKVSLTVNGGSLTLSGANTYTGATTVSAGTLALGANNALPTTDVSIGSATLDAATFTDTVGTLDVTSTAVINLGTGAAIAFADSSAIDWTAGSLNINGTLGATSVRFGTTSGGLTAPQRAAISVNNAGAGTYTLDASGYLVAGGGNTYATWIGANGPATGFVTDSDKDGLSNGVENVLGSNPNTFNTGLTEVSATATSVVFKHALNPTIASDVTYSYQWSTDMVEWKASGQTNTGGTTATIGASVPVPGVVTVTINITGGPSAKLFGRLVVTGP